MPSSHVYFCTEGIFQVVLFTLGNKNISWLKFILVSLFALVIFYDLEMFFFYLFQFLCLSMYSHFRTRFRFLKNKCVQTRNLNTDL